MLRKYTTVSWLNEAKIKIVWSPVAIKIKLYVGALNLQQNIGVKTQCNSNTCIVYSNTCIVYSNQPKYSLFYIKFCEKK